MMVFDYSSKRSCYLLPTDYTVNGLINHLGYTDLLSLTCHSCLIQSSNRRRGNNECCYHIAHYMNDSKNIEKRERKKGLCLMLYSLNCRKLFKRWSYKLKLTNTKINKLMTIVQLMNKTRFILCFISSSDNESLLIIHTSFQLNSNSGFKLIP